MAYETFTAQMERERHMAALNLVLKFAPQYEDACEGADSLRGKIAQLREVLDGIDERLASLTPFKGWDAATFQPIP